MVADIVRDAAVGQLVRLFTKKRLLRYPEEESDFQIPAFYDAPNADSKVDDRPEVDLEKQDDMSFGCNPADSTLSALDISASSSKAELDVPVQQDLQQTVSKPVIPEKLDDGTILVTWYTDDDQSNPQNWSLAKKSVSTGLIMLYTTAVYLGGSIYAPASGEVMEVLGVSAPVASLGLALYVVGYGFGPLLWSPLSEVPSIGRNPIYIATFAVFTILAIPTALANNIGGLLVLRFLMGFFGSPALATGGATLGDMFSMVKIPYLLSLWALSACLGPAIGPLISGFSVTAKDWHWALWEVLWLAGPTFIVMALFLPETNAATILLQRARRLRALEPTKRLTAQSEIGQGSMTWSATAFEALYRPWQLNILDPAIAFTSVYTGLMYALFYSFFEAFPLTYIDIYHFNLGEMGVTFLSAAVGFGLATVVYWIYLYYYMEARIEKQGMVPQEERLVPALFASILMPVGMFIYGWTSREDIHWIVPSIGVAIVTFGVFIVFQCIFVYLPMTYPKYTASLFAGNDVIRSSLAAGAILYSTPLFTNLGIGPGSSLLAALMAVCVVGIWILWAYGAKLRSKSRFADK